MNKDSFCRLRFDVETSSSGIDEQLDRALEEATEGMFDDGLSSTTSFEYLAFTTILLKL